eukprot:346473-Prorocentrum_minimum.AAC.2
MSQESETGLAVEGLRSQLQAVSLKLKEELSTERQKGASLLAENARLSKQSKELTATRAQMQASLDEKEKTAQVLQDSVRHRDELIARLKEENAAQVMQWMTQENASAQAAQAAQVAEGQMKEKIKLLEQVAGQKEEKIQEKMKHLESELKSKIEHERVLEYRNQDLQRQVERYPPLSCHLDCQASPSRCNSSLRSRP